MTEFSVETTAELETALAGASSGDVVSLKDSIASTYSGFVADHIQIPPGVTLKPHPGNTTTLTIKGLPRETAAQTGSAPLQILRMNFVLDGLGTSEGGGIFLSNVDSLIEDVDISGAFNWGIGGGQGAVRFAATSRISIMTLRRVRVLDAPQDGLDTNAGGAEDTIGVKSRLFAYDCLFQNPGTDSPGGSNLQCVSAHNKLPIIAFNCVARSSHAVSATIADGDADAIYTQWHGGLIEQTVSTQLSKFHTLNRTTVVGPVGSSVTIACQRAIRCKLTRAILQVGDEGATGGLSPFRTPHWYAGNQFDVQDTQKRPLTVGKDFPDIVFAFNLIRNLSGVNSYACYVTTDNAPVRFYNNGMIGLPGYGLGVENNTVARVSACIAKNNWATGIDLGMFRVLWSTGTASITGDYNTGALLNGGSYTLGANDISVEPEVDAASRPIKDGNCYLNGIPELTSWEDAIGEAPAVPIDGAFHRGPYGFEE